MLSYTTASFKWQLSIPFQIFYKISYFSRCKIYAFPLLGFAPVSWYLMTTGLGQNTCLCPYLKIQADQEVFHLECLPLENETECAPKTPITIKKLEHATFCKYTNLKFSFLHHIKSYTYVLMI